MLGETGLIIIEGAANRVTGGVGRQLDSTSKRDGLNPRMAYESTDTSPASR
jgi:hypothetical protein